MSNVENLQGAEALSALVDGEADAGAAASLSARWRDEAALRERWHSYQLIGDVLRSEELAGRGRDAAFLQRLRTQLDREPVVLAPRVDRVAEESAAALPRQRAAGGGLRRWATPAAVAAGFLAVIGSLAVTRLSGPQADAPQLAQAPVVPAEAPQRVVLAAPADQVEPASGVLIRDARLDQYLAAHKQFGGSSALSVPSGFLRSATYDGATAAAR
ncbi:sigma-E factor negative regulatory protein [Methylibium petroleiphilum]|uniref:sigma-E factor negative regulatory protein n=1 Tax=Methylibium petroleiphilum TaxID=105560 RepID=UPI001AC2B065|nr:sigma-E factor negative regulatory protein [Methylibium petroleiphilum]MBN9204209.1 sigma-E factor negative regulatory protein [Methylibium petroleiphilum]